jgi:hypothetical protein
LPTILANNGAIIRKPLPTIDESGVNVACQDSLFCNFLKLFFEGDSLEDLSNPLWGNKNIEELYSRSIM